MSRPRYTTTSRQKKKETFCEKMAGFLKVLGLENKPEYSEKIPETLCDQDFHLHDTFHHGFPSHPSCLAYDPVQKILAIATKHGTVALLGKPGLEGMFTHPETCSVTQMEFIANKNMLVTSCDNRTLYQWSLAEKKPTIRHQLEFNKECPTTMSWTYGSEWLYVGNDAGNVHLVHVNNFTLSGYVIHWNAVVEGQHKMRPGDVMAVREHPMDQGKVLIAYSSSLLVLWNIRNKCCDKRYTHDPGINHVLTSVSWLGNGKLFSSSYSDGTLVIWNTKVDAKPDKVFEVHETEAEARVSKVVYKLQVQMTESEPWFICSGGYPEEHHSCPKTITVRHGKFLNLLATTSTIVDFLSLPSTPFTTDPQKPLALVILTKDELVVHDLQTDNFPQFSLPHALDIHMPPVSCLEYHANCPEELIASLHSVKSKMLHHFTSSKQWPLMGGKWGQESPYLPTDLILTGHTDGSVRLWYCSSVIFQPFFTLPTTPFFKYTYTPAPMPHSGSPSPTRKFNKTFPTSTNPDDPKIPPQRPPPPNIMGKCSSAPRFPGEDVGQETGEPKGNMRQVRSEQFSILRHVSEGSEQGAEGEEEEEEELERLKTPSPATGQLRVEGDEGTDGQAARCELTASPGSIRKTTSSREKKSKFKLPTKGRLSASDSPRLSPRHHADNVSEISDDRSESPVPAEDEKKREKRGKHVRKLKSFKKAAMKVKIGRKFMSKGSSSEEREDTDATSLGPSEAGEEVEGEEGADGEVMVEAGAGKEDTDSSVFHAVKTNICAKTKRPESLSAPPTEGGAIKLKKGSKSFRQDKRISAVAMTPSEQPKKSFMRDFSRRISVPGNFRVGTPTSAGPPGKCLNSEPSNEPVLTPIVEVSPPNVASDSVFSMEEDVFAVQGIKCCMWGQWMCVSNAGGHVMAFSFQMNDSVTIPKTVDIDFDKDTVLKCGNNSANGQTPFVGWALNERASENSPGFRLRQHVRCFTSGTGGEGDGGAGGEGGGSYNMPMAVRTVQYSVDIGLLAVGTNKGLAVIDTENNTVLHVLSSLTSLLYMTNPSKFTRQVTRESTQMNFQSFRPTIHRHSTHWNLPHSASSGGLMHVNSPARKPATSARVSVGKEGQGVGVADSALSPCDGDREYTIVDCESSITALDMVQLPLDKQAPPTLTLWVGTASGHTVTYGVRLKGVAAEENGRGGGGGGGGVGGRGGGGNGKKRTIQLMPTGLISEHKYPIVTMQFLNQWGDRQIVPYHMSKDSSMRVDEGRRRVMGDGVAAKVSTAANSKKENYIIIVDERKIKSYLFPGMTVINRATAIVENTTLLSSQYFLCRDLPCLLTLTSSHHVIIHSLPGLMPIVNHHYTPLINQRVMSTFRVSGDGQALFMSSESEIQRLCIAKEDRLNLPHCLPDFHMPTADPQPVSKGKMDWLFGSVPAEMDRASMFGVTAGRPLVSAAKRDGVSGAGSHQNTGTRSRRRAGEDEDRGTGRGGGRDERGRGREEDRGRGGRERLGQEGRREASGLAGQMNRNREALEQRKQALSELEQKTVQMAGDADDFATLAAKLANKNRMKSQ